MVILRKVYEIFRHLSESWICCRGPHINQVCVFHIARVDKILCDLQIIEYYMICIPFTTKCLKICAQCIVCRAICANKGLRRRKSTLIAKRGRQEVGFEDECCFFTILKPRTNELPDIYNILKPHSFITFLKLTALTHALKLNLTSFQECYF